jgi:hypothetical protein
MVPAEIAVPVPAHLTTREEGRAPAMDALAH